MSGRSRFVPGYYSKRPEDPLGDQAVASMERISKILLDLVSPNNDLTHPQALSEIALACKSYLDVKLKQSEAGALWASLGKEPSGS